MRRGEAQLQSRHGKDDESLFPVDLGYAKEFNSAQDTFTLAMLCLLSVSAPIAQKLQDALLNLLRHGAVETFRWISAGLALRTSPQSEDLQEDEDDNLMSSLAEEDLEDSERLILETESEIRARH